MIGSVSIFGFFNKTVLAIKYALLTERAWDRVARKKFTEAEKLINRARQLMPDMMTEDKVKLAYINFRIKKDMKAISLFEDAWSAIDKDKKLLDDEKTYLRIYISGVLYGITNLLVDGSPVYIEKFRHPVFINKIELLKIRKSMRKNYPVREHPDWIEE